MIKLNHLLIYLLEDNIKMLTQNFMKPLDKVSDEEWEEIYLAREAQGKFFSNSIYDGSSLKAVYFRARAQEEAMKAHLEKISGNAVRFMDPDRDIVYLYPQKNSNNPDLVMFDPIYGKTTIEVKNYHYTELRDFKLKFNLYLNPSITTEKQVLDRIWEYDFHNADMVAFITPECDKYCWINRYDLSLDVKKVNQPPYGSDGKFPITFYAKREDWFSLN